MDPFSGSNRNPLSLNRYSWVQGNVPNLADPSGMAPFNFIDFIKTVLRHTR